MNVNTLCFLSMILSIGIGGTLYSMDVATSAATSKIVAITHKQFDAALPLVKDFLARISKEVQTTIELGSENVHFQNAQILVCFSHLDGRIDASGVLDELRPDGARKIPYKILISLGTRHDDAEIVSSDSQPFFNKIIKCPIIYSLSTHTFLPLTSDEYRKFKNISTVIKQLGQDIKNLKIHTTPASLPSVPALKGEPKHTGAPNLPAPQVKMKAAVTGKIIAVTHKQFDAALPYVKDFLARISKEIQTPIALGAESDQFESAHILVCFSHLDGRIDAPGVLSELQPGAQKIPHKILISLGTRYDDAEIESSDPQPFNKIIKCPIIYSFSTKAFLPLTSDEYKKYNTIDTVIKKLGQDIKTITGL